MIARKSSATMGAAEEHSTCNCEEFECDNGRSRAVLRVFEGFEYDDGRSRAVLQVFEAATHTALTCFLLLEQVCVSFGAGCFDQLWKPALPALPALSLPSYLHITMLHSCYCLPDSHVVQVLRNTTDAWCPLLVHAVLIVFSISKRRSSLHGLSCSCSSLQCLLRPVGALLSPGPSCLCSALPGPGAWAMISATRSSNLIAAGSQMRIWNFWMHQKNNYSPLCEFNPCNGRPKNVKECIF